MKAFKAICSATVLALALSVPTYAGDILTPGVISPPPPPPSCTSAVKEPAVFETKCDQLDFKNCGDWSRAALFSVRLAGAGIVVCPGRGRDSAHATLILHGKARAN